MDAEYVATLRARLRDDVESTLREHGRLAHDDSDADLIDELVEDGMHPVEQVIARSLSD